MILLTLLLACPVPEAVDPGPGAHELYLPPLYAAVGAPLELYFDTAMTADGDPPEGEPVVVGDFDWTVLTDAPGETEATHWTWTPEHAGTWDLELRQHRDGEWVGTAATTVEVVPGHRGQCLTIATLGDSLTYMGYWVDDLGAYLPAATFVGTLEPSPLGRWTDGWYGASAYRWTTHPDSPLLVDGALDVEPWLADLGAVPDVVVIMLGINRVITGHDHLWEGYVDDELEAIDQVMAALLDAGVGACVPALTTPGHDDQAAWTGNYAGERWEDQYQWEQRHRHQLRLQVERWSDREDEGIFLAAVATAVDPADAYPDDNAIHPRPGWPGYAQLAPPVHAAISRSQQGGSTGAVGR